MGIPLFHVGYFSCDFSGSLYFVLGQGLGDHVNGFRILIEVQQRFPHALCIVYADLRWEELVRRLEKVEIRWYPKAKDILSKEGTNNPYDRARETIRTEIAMSNGKAFLAHAHFPMPDRHARQESTLEAAARTIGIALGENARPYLPLLSSDIKWATQFLAKNKLEKGKYAVISPLSWPNKVWGKENFSALIDHLYRSFGLRTIIASYPEIGPFETAGSICAFDLTLGQLAGILACAGVYVGLDSGPSHMAAFFDIPMVVIYVEKKVIPFEVRTLSPHSLLVVESFFNPVPVPAVQTVLDSATFLLGAHESGAGLPECLACGRKADHVVASEAKAIRLMCACGLSIDKNIRDNRVESFTRISEERLEESPTKNELSAQDDVLIVDSDLSTISSFLETDQKFCSSARKITVRLERQSVAKEGLKLNSGSLTWGIDALFFWLREKGYLTFEYSSDGEEGTIRFSIPQGSEEKSSSLLFSWGRWKIKTTVNRYLCWYTFSRWADPKILVGIVKSMTELGFPRNERLACAVVAFRTERSFRSFRWIIKSLFW